MAAGLHRQAHMFAAFENTLTWTETFKRTVRETMADNGLGLAAQLAYYFFLALFPALLFLIALASFFPLENIANRLVGMLGGVAPDEMLGVIRDQIQQISQGQHGGLLTIGVAAALWSSSAAMVALIDALNRSYGVEDARPWWKQRLTAIALTIAVALFVLVSFTLVVAGPQLAGWLADQFGLGQAFAMTWSIVQWPVVFVLVATGIGLVYYFAPDVDQDWAWLTPGALLATVLWLVGSLGFRFYVTNFGEYNETYGAIGGVILLLLWFYLSGLVIIVGAVMNAQIEHAAPHAKAAGEKAPGERKMIGPRAARAFRARQGGTPAVAPGPRGMPVPAGPAARLRESTATMWARAGVVLAGLAAFLGGRDVKN
jgi:membrane protein